VRRLRVAREDDHRDVPELRMGAQLFEDAESILRQRQAEIEHDHMSARSSAASRADVPSATAATS